MDDSHYVTLTSASYSARPTSLGFITPDSNCFIIEPEGKVYLLYWLSAIQTDEDNEEHEKQYIAYRDESVFISGMQTIYLIQFLSTFAIDLACAVGFMNPNTRGRKKKSAAGA